MLGTEVGMCGIPAERARFVVEGEEARCSKSYFTTLECEREVMFL